MVVIRCYNRATILWHHFAASKRVSSTYSYFCSSFASKLLLVQSYYSSSCYYRQLAYVYVAYYVRPDARNVARAVLTRAGSLSPRDQSVVVFPVLGIPASNTVTLIAGCPPKHKTSRLQSDCNPDKWRNDGIDEGWKINGHVAARHHDNSTQIQYGTKCD